MCVWTAELSIFFLGHSGYGMGCKLEKEQPAEFSFVFHSSGIHFRVAARSIVAIVWTVFIDDTLCAIAIALAGEYATVY